jgi:hypothetical protein
LVNESVFEDSEKFVAALRKLIQAD